jgi:hypothetical protein
MDIEQAFEDISDLWPKKKDKTLVEHDREVFNRVVLDDNDVTRLRNAVEAFLEDNPRKVPPLYQFIEKVFKSQSKTPPTPSDGEVAEGNITNLYQKQDIGNQGLEKRFDELYETWPRSMNNAESRTKALAAFLSACRGETPENILSACKTYSGTFYDASEGLVYPMLMRNFLGDKETLTEWISKANGKGAFDEFTRKQFDAAYAWYPEFNSKSTDKTKRASMVVWYRVIPKDERLDFLISCKTYYYERIKNIAESDSHTNAFTKSFNTFMGEWRQVLDKNDNAMNKRDVIGRMVCDVALDNNFDLRNIYCDDPEDFFLEKALPYFLYKLPTIRYAIRASFEKAIGNVDDARNGSLNYVKDMTLAEKQVAALDIDKLTDTIMNKLAEVKSIEMPLDRE